jgi:hypothetical protein
MKGSSGAHPILDVEPRVVVAGDVVPVTRVLHETRDELLDGLAPPVRTRRMESHM